jgi:hypothetical protein
MEEKVGMGGKLSRTEIEDGKNLAKFKMALLTNEAMEEDGEYSGNYSGARGRGRNARRDSRGRYSSEYGYSRAAEDMASQLREMAQDAPDEQSRMDIERLANRMESMM